MSSWFTRVVVFFVELLHLGSHAWRRVRNGQSDWSMGLTALNNKEIISSIPWINVSLETITPPPPKKNIKIYTNNLRSDINKKKKITYIHFNNS